MACISRNCWRHLPTVIPNSERNNRSIVLLLAPTVRHSWLRGRRSLGSDSRTSAILRARESVGLGSCKGTVRIARNWSRITWIKCRWSKIVPFRTLKSHVSRMSSRSRGEMFITQHCRGSIRASLGFKYNVRIATGPDIAMLCGMFAGIQTARCVGTTHAPCSVRMVITPREAYTS